LFTLSFCSEPSRGGEKGGFRIRRQSSFHVNPLHQSNRLQRHYKTSESSVNLKRPRKRSLSDGDSINIPMEKEISLYPEVTERAQTPPEKAFRRSPFVAFFSRKRRSTQSKQQKEKDKEKDERGILVKERLKTT